MSHNEVSVARLLWLIILINLTSATILLQLRHIDRDPTWTNKGRIVFTVILRTSFHELSISKPTESEERRGEGGDNGLSMERSRFRSRADSSIRKPVWWGPAIVKRRTGYSHRRSRWMSRWWHNSSWWNPRCRFLVSFRLRRTDRLERGCVLENFSGFQSALSLHFLYH